MFFSARVRLPPTEGAVSILVATTSAVLKMAGSLSGLSPLSVTPSSTAHISSLRSWLAGQTRWPTFSGIRTPRFLRSTDHRGVEAANGHGLPGLIVVVVEDVLEHLS